MIDKDDLIQFSELMYSLGITLDDIEEHLTDTAKRIVEIAGEL